MKIQLQQAANDDKVKAVVLNIDSPGGEVTASDSIYNAVRKLRDGGFGPPARKKPVVVYMGSMAASGGFYVACGGTFLMANETTLTGSIGVIMETLNYQQLFGKVGLETTTQLRAKPVQRHAERRAGNDGRGEGLRAEDGHGDLRKIRRHRGARAQDQ